MRNLLSAAGRRRPRFLIALAVGALAAGLVFTGAHTASAMQIFYDDFQDGDATGWAPTGGTWSVVTDGTTLAYRQADQAADARSIHTTAHSGAYEFFSAKAKILSRSSTGSVSVIALATDATRYYYLALRPTTVEIGRRDGATFTVLASSPFTTQVGVWYQFSVRTFISSQLGVTVSGGTPASSVTLNTNLVTTGINTGNRLGFATKGATAVFDEVNVGDDRVAPTSSRPPSVGPSVSVSPSSSPSPSPSVSPSPSPLPSARCTATYLIMSQWPGAFQASLAIRNTGPALTSWTVSWSFADGQKVSNIWAATWTQVGPVVTAWNAAWNGNVATNGTITIGFQASAGAVNSKPTAFTLNGEACVTL